MNPHSINLFARILLTCAALVAHTQAYQVFSALPYIPPDAAKKIKLWQEIAKKSEGLSLNDSDTQAKVRNTSATWKATVAKFKNAKNNGMAAIPRTHWNYGTVTRKGTLEERLELIFKQKGKMNAQIKWVMLYGSQPGENRAKDAYSYTPEDVKRAKEWLKAKEKKGHPPVKLCWNVRNNGKGERELCLDPNVDAILIEGSPKLWYSNRGRRQDFLKWVTTDPKTRNKPLIFQVPFNQTPDKEDIYYELRKFVHWLASDKMLGNHDLLRRDDVIFLPITYNTRPPFYPETNESGRQYQNTLAGASLSLIEQREIFEGRSSQQVSDAFLRDRTRTEN